MAATKKKAAIVPLYTDMAKPDELGEQNFGEEGDAAKAALDSDTAASTYESVDIPGAGGHVQQKRGKIK